MFAAPVAACPASGSLLTFSYTACRPHSFWRTQSSLPRADEPHWLLLWVRHGRHSCSSAGMGDHGLLRPLHPLFCESSLRLCHQTCLCGLHTLLGRLLFGELLSVDPGTKHSAFLVTACLCTQLLCCSCLHAAIA